jgi:type II secretory ATPase GspE/PulE/Tfp pilus assembly ATPase PilB-like protein
MIAESTGFAYRSGRERHRDRDLSWCVELLDQPPSEAVGRLVEHAFKVGASDIFFSSVEDGVVVTIRRLGRVEHIGHLPPQQGLRCVTFMRTVAAMKLEETRRPQDGLWEFSATDGHRINLRVSTIPTMYGQSVAMRVLDVHGECRNLDSLGLVGPQADTLTEVLETPGGLILLTGPTGSGKSTTLYACLDYLNDGSRKIHTLEDPIECVLPGLHQTQVSDFCGTGFFELLRGVMRQNPDVIMIGEIRDPTTAETAVRAANSGQLVFSTLHAHASAVAIQNMLSFGVPAEFLTSALTAIISQRLVRTLAGGARRQIDRSAAPNLFDDVTPWLDGHQPATAYVPASPRGPDGGYVDRTGIFEILRITPAIRQLILDRALAHAIADRAVSEGMFDFRRAGLLQVARGITSLDEIRRHVPSSGFNGSPPKVADS